MKERIARPAKAHVLPFTAEQMAVDAEMRFYHTYGRPYYTESVLTSWHRTSAVSVGEHIVYFTWYKQRGTRLCFASDVHQYDSELIPAVLAIRSKKSGQFLVPRSRAWNDVIGRIKMDMVAWLLKG